MRKNWTNLTNLCGKADHIEEGRNTEDNDHTDQTNEYDIYPESSSRLSTETFIIGDDHRECELTFKVLAPIDGIIPEVGHEPSDEEQTE